jgi:hypothetical protein
MKASSSRMLTIVPNPLRSRGGGCANRNWLFDGRSSGSSSSSTNNMLSSSSARIGVNTMNIPSIGTDAVHHFRQPRGLLSDIRGYVKSQN